MAPKVGGSPHSHAFVQPSFSNHPKLSSIFKTLSIGVSPSTFTYSPPLNQEVSRFRFQVSGLDLSGLDLWCSKQKLFRFDSRAFQSASENIRASFEITLSTSQRGATSPGLLS